MVGRKNIYVTGSCATLNIVVSLTCAANLYGAFTILCYCNRKETPYRLKHPEVLESVTIFALISAIRVGAIMFENVNVNFYLGKG